MTCKIRNALDIRPKSIVKFTAMSQPYFQNVLEHFCKKNYFQNGLTIPFLIGARKILEQHDDVLTVQDFIEEIESSKNKVTIMKCGNINEFIVGLMDLETEKMIQQFPSIYKTLGNFVCTDESLDTCNNIHEIGELLSHRYSYHLESGKYSKIDGDWQYFSKLDLNRLSEINLKE